MANRKVTVLNPAGYQEQLQPGDDAAFDSSNITLGTDKITLDAGDGSGKFSGVVESTSGGFKFPDGTTQTTAGGSVDSVNSKTGDVVLTASDVGAIPTGGAVTKITAGSNITISPTSGTGNVTINSSGSDGIPEAPNDGKQYGRQNQNWTQIISSGGGGGGGDSLWQQSGSTLIPIAGANSISLSGQVNCGGEITIEQGGQSRFVLDYAAPTASTAAPTITSDGTSLYYYGKNGTAGEHVFYSGGSNDERLRISSSGSATFGGRVDAYADGSITGKTTPAFTTGNGAGASIRNAIFPDGSQAWGGDGTFAGAKATVDGPTGAATFDGAVTVGSNLTVQNGITSLQRDASGGNPLLTLGSTTTDYGKITINGVASFKQVKIGAEGAWDKINLDSSGAATFGDGVCSITSAGNQQWGGAPWTGTAGTFASISGTVYTCPSTSSNAAFSAYEVGTTTVSAAIKGDGSALFKGGVQVGGDVKVGDSDTIYTKLYDGSMLISNTTAAGQGFGLYNTTTGAYTITMDMDGEASFANSVGIGVNNPVTDLHVSREGSPAIRLENTSDSGNADLQLKLKTNTFNIGCNSTANYFNDLAGSAYIWYQAGNEVLRIDTSGDIVSTGSADVKQLNITTTFSDAAGATELIDLKLNGSGTGPTGDVYGVKADLTAPNTSDKLYGYYIESKAGTAQSTWGGYASAKANSSGQSAVGLLGEALVQAGAGQVIGSTAGVKGVGQNYTGPGNASKVIGVMAENLCDSGNTAWGFYGSTQTGATTVTPFELVHDGSTIHKVAEDGSITAAGSATFASTIKTSGSESYFSVDRTGSHAASAALFLGFADGDQKFKVGIDGKITAAGQVYSSGFLADTPNTDTSIVFRGKDASNNTTTSILADGSASFGGRLNVTTLSTAGDLVAQFKNEDAGGARQSSFQYTNDGELKLYSISSNSNPTVTIESNDGSATFAGALEAASIDGGTYQNRYSSYYC